MLPWTSIKAGPVLAAAEPLSSGRKLSLRSVIGSVVFSVIVPRWVNDTGPSREMVLVYGAREPVPVVLIAREESTEPSGTPISVGFFFSPGVTAMNAPSDWIAFSDTVVNWRTRIRLPLGFVAAVEVPTVSRPSWVAVWNESNVAATVG